MTQAAENRKCLCHFDGQIYCCAARDWLYQQPCGYALKSPHRNQCVYYNSGYSDRCENMAANKAARENHQP